MSTATSDLNSISRQFMSLDRSKKPKMLVVDDEPDNLDLLYRTFRRDFTVLKAESGVAALDILAAEGEVAVIISDQRMPEMKGTEFLSKTVPQFPDTMRIILTGFTDVEDLVDAINSGQVYKYITKPWDPNELKMVVQRAAETYELLKHRTEELKRAHTHTALMDEMIQIAQQATRPEACLDPIATALGTTFKADTCILQLVTGQSLGAQGCSGGDGNQANGISQDPLFQQAIATAQMQVAINSPVDVVSARTLPHPESGLQAHLIVPVLYQQQLLAVLSLQWKQPYVLHEEELNLIELSARQIGMVLTCVQRQPVLAQMSVHN
jgi:CheY-like chemotaxis protein